MKTNTARGLFLLLAIATWGCFLEVERVDRSDASRTFREAQNRIHSIERQDPGRRGPVKRFHLLAYDGDERKLVRLKLPAGLFCSDWDGRKDFDFDWDRGHRRGPLSDWHRDWSSREILAFGPGLLLEATERNDRVLIWLE